MLTGERKEALFQAARPVWPGGVVCSESSCCIHSTSGIPWHLFFGAWRVVLYWSGKAWGQDHWWWALQVGVPENSLSYGGWCQCPCEGDVGSGHYSPKSDPWCNAIVLVCNKDWGLWFCINFHKLNARAKKDSYSLPQIQEAIKSLVGAGYFSCLDLKAGFWLIAMDEALKQ